MAPVTFFLHPMDASVAYVLRSNWERKALKKVTGFYGLPQFLQARRFKYFVTFSTGDYVAKRKTQLVTGLHKYEGQRHISYQCKYVLLFRFHFLPYNFLCSMFSSFSPFSLSCCVVYYIASMYIFPALGISPLFPSFVCLFPQCYIPYSHIKLLLIPFSTFNTLPPFLRKNHRRLVGSPCCTFASTYLHFKLLNKFADLHEL